MAKTKKATKGKKPTTLRDLPGKPQRDAAVKGGGNGSASSAGSSGG